MEQGKIKKGNYYNTNGVLMHTITKIKTESNDNIVYFLDHTAGGIEIGMILETYIKYFVNEFGFIYHKKK